MTTEKIYSALRTIGLNDREIKLYVANLQLGETGMGELARAAGLKRTSAYVVFTSLEEKGLVGSFRRKSGLRFMAKDPMFLVEKTQREMSAINEVLPELKALSTGRPDKPKITYFEGREAYRRIAEECLKDKNTIMRHIGSLSEAYRILGQNYDLEFFVPQRIKNKISLRALYLPDTKTIFKKDNGNELREVRYLPEKTNIKTLTLIHGNKVIISTGSETLGIAVIESEEIAQAEKEKFDLIWRMADKL